MATEAEQREEAMAQVYRAVDRARLTWRTVEAVDGLLRTFIVGGSALIVGLVVDNLVHLPSTVRIAYGMLLLAVVLALLGRFAIYPLFRSLNDEIRDRVAVGARAGGSEAVRIDVESELETIRGEVGDADADDEELTVSK